MRWRYGTRFFAAAVIFAVALVSHRPAQGSERPLDEALENAYQHRNRVQAERLLALGANPSATVKNCLLRRAAADDETGFLHLFLGYRPVPEGMLYQYCRPGKRHIAELLLAHGARPNPSRAPFLESPFSAALILGEDSLACRLLDAGASPVLHGSLGQQALPVAIVKRQLKTVTRLLEFGASPNAELKPPIGERFIGLARGMTLRWLLRKDSRVRPLMLAVDSGSLEITQALLDHGAETDVWTRRSSIWPISLAGRHQDVKMMRLLLGKDPHVEERLVIVDLSEQRLRVYGPSGEEVFITRISTGKKGFPTPTGEFAITNRHRLWDSTVYHSKMPYFQRLSCSDFGLHQGDVPNRPVSHGCIRVPEGSAAKLFQLTQLGDRVRIQP